MSLLFSSAQRSLRPLCLSSRRLSVQSGMHAKPAICAVQLRPKPDCREDGALEDWLCEGRSLLERALHARRPADSVPKSAIIGRVRHTHSNPDLCVVRATPASRVSHLCRSGITRSPATSGYTYLRTIIAMAARTRWPSSSRAMTTCTCGEPRMSGEPG